MISQEDKIDEVSIKNSIERFGGTLFCNSLQEILKIDENIIVINIRNLKGEILCRVKLDCFLLNSDIRNKMFDRYRDTRIIFTNINKLQAYLNTYKNKRKCIDENHILYKFDNSYYIRLIKCEENKTAVLEYRSDIISYENNIYIIIHMKLKNYSLISQYLALYDGVNYSSMKEEKEKDFIKWCETTGEIEVTDKIFPIDSLIKNKNQLSFPESQFLRKIKCKVENNNKDIRNSIEYLCIS